MQRISKYRKHITPSPEKENSPRSSAKVWADSVEDSKDVRLCRLLDLADRDGVALANAKAQGPADDQPRHYDLSQTSTSPKATQLRRRKNMSNVRRLFVKGRLLQDTVSLLVIVAVSKEEAVQKRDRKGESTRYSWGCSAAALDDRQKSRLDERGLGILADQNIRDAGRGIPQKVGKQGKEIHTKVVVKVVKKVDTMHLMGLLHMVM
jgi:hypothetical protein